MSLFHMHYGCHEDALVILKSNGKVYRVRGNVGLWDMTAILMPHESADPAAINGEGWLYMKADEFKRDVLVLDEGRDKLSEALKTGLRKLAR